MRSPRPFLSGSLALVVLGILAGGARAEVPTLDIEKTCANAGQVNLGSNASAQESRDGCLRSEREARKEAERRWGDYTPAAKKQCESQFQAGGYPSYVEMVTCLELASGTVPSQTGAGGTATGGPGAGRGDIKAPREQNSGAGSLTQEPPASQRTDPIKVLEDK